MPIYFSDLRNSKSNPAMYNNVAHMAILIEQHTQTQLTLPDHHPSRGEVYIVNFLIKVNEMCIFRYASHLTIKILLTLLPIGVVLLWANSAYALAKLCTNTTSN